MEFMTGNLQSRAAENRGKKIQKIKLLKDNKNNIL